MTRKSYPPEEIAKQLKEAENLIADGASVAEAAQSIGVKYGTLYQWRRKYSVAASEGIRRIKELEAENARLRKALEELDRPGSVFLRNPSTA
ncbi:MAG: transposase [Terricaulis sp.]